MKKFFKKIARTYRGEESGFTLIELLIVIVILGVLAAAIVPNLTKFIGAGTVGAANAELASIRTSISAYQADKLGALPTATPSTGGQVVNGLLTGANGYTQGTIKGVYTVDATGMVTSATLGTWTGIVWDSSNSNWKHS